MSAIDIRRLLRVAWERAKASQGLRDEDPVVENVQVSVIRTIAELEVARLQRDESATPDTVVSPLPQEHAGDHDLPKVA
jgi:hypothetical protein